MDKNTVMNIMELLFTQLTDEERDKLAEIGKASNDPVAFVLGMIDGCLREKDGGDPVGFLKNIVTGEIQILTTTP